MRGARRPRLAVRYLTANGLGSLAPRRISVRPEVSKGERRAEDEDANGSIYWNFLRSYLA